LLLLVIIYYLGDAALTGSGGADVPDDLGAVVVRRGLRQPRGPAGALRWHDGLASREQRDGRLEDAARHDPRPPAGARGDGGAQRGLTH